MASPYLHALSCSKCGAALAAQPGQQILSCHYCGQYHVFVPPPPPERPGTRYVAGDRVAVEWGGHWWPATVHQTVGAHEWRVHFEGWNQQWDSVVGPSRIRHISQATRSSPKQTLAPVLLIAGVATLVVGAAGAFFALGATDRQGPTPVTTPHAGPGDPNSQVVQAVGNAAGFAVGDSVEIEWKGTWYAGKILKVDAGRYRITYEGWSSSWDEWVDVSRLRPR